VADIRSGTHFKALVAQTTAVLLTRGLEIEPVAVRDVVGYVVNTAAKNVGVDADEAVHLVSPEVVADAIEAAADDSGEDAAAVHAVRPVRKDIRTVEVPTMALGRLVMAGAQAGKYASANRDGRSAAHAMDLVTELGSATVSASGGDLVDVPVGVLNELADLVERVAGRIDTGEWSICPCGVPLESIRRPSGSAVARENRRRVRRLRPSGSGVTAGCLPSVPDDSEVTPVLVSPHLSLVAEGGHGDRGLLLRARASDCKLTPALPGTAHRSSAQPAAEEQGMDVVHERVAALDVSKRDAKVCVRALGKRKGTFTKEVTTWGSMTSDVLKATY
jgi:hypothetical protein